MADDDGADMAPHIVEVTARPVRRTRREQSTEGPNNAVLAPQLEPVASVHSSQEEETVEEPELIQPTLIQAQGSEEERKSESRKSSTSEAPPPDPEERQTGPPPLSRANTFTIEEFQRTLPKQTQESTEEEYVYIEQRKSFRRAKKETLEMLRAMQEAQQPHEEFARTRQMRSVQSAISVQTAFRQLSIIIQGLLAGLTTAHAVFAFNFADPMVLLRGYRWMSLPVHCLFYIGFLVGLMSALDRVHWENFTWENRSRWIRTGGGLVGLLPWLVGIVATTVTIEVDEELSPAISSPQLSNQSLRWWKIFSAIRAFCAIVSWLMTAFQTNMDALTELLHVFLLPEDERDAREALDMPALAIGSEQRPGALQALPLANPQHIVASIAHSAPT